MSKQELRSNFLRLVKTIEDKNLPPMSVSWYWDHLKELGARQSDIAAIFWDLEHEQVLNLRQDRKIEAGRRYKLL